MMSDSMECGLNCHKFKLELVFYIVNRPGGFNLASVDYFIQFVFQNKEPETCLC